MTTPKPLKRDRSERGTWWTLKRRRWAYGVAVAAGGVAVAFGLITEAMLASVLVLAGALLGVAGLAVANPTED